LKRGDDGEEISELQNYLKQFGYLDIQDGARKFGIEVDTKGAPPQPVEAGVFDETTENGLKSFQEFYSLPATGQLNKETINLMLKPRCGVIDPVLKGKKFVTAQFGKWKKTSLTYNFANFSSDLNETAIKNAVKTAFKQWSSVSPLTFSEVSGKSDITFKFGARDHGCGIAFDGPSQVLAHAYFPGTGKDGIVDFDEDELWTDDDPATGIDLATVALHELGHTLGLDHSQVKKAIMFAFYGGRLLTLFPDDIAGIQSLYGKRN
jgi:hypothetical protein